MSVIQQVSVYEELHKTGEKSLFFAFCSLGVGGPSPPTLPPAKHFGVQVGVISILDEIFYMVRELCHGRPALSARGAFAANLERAGMSTAYPGKGMWCPSSRTWMWLLGCDINNAGGGSAAGTPTRA